MKKRKRVVIWLYILIVTLLPRMDVVAAVDISAPSAILIEASTGEVIFEQNADERRSPASITKIMTLLLTFEQLEEGKINLSDEVITSEYASSMGGSQVYLAEGEKQTLETMLKCIIISSANDASVAVAEHIAGSEEAFVEQMNERAAQLGMENTHFEDCCGLTDSDGHYTSARDVAVMSRELILKHPRIYDYTTIWMENITHETKQGSSLFTLSSTNKLLKQYPYATGLKTGSTAKAKFCLSATARKDDIDMIAVILGAEDGKTRFNEAKELLSYGFTVSDLYLDENKESPGPVMIKGGLQDMADLEYAGEYRYLDMEGNNLDAVEKRIELSDLFVAPVKQGDKAGEAIYSLNGRVLGSVDILFAETVEKADYGDYLYRIFLKFLV